MCAFDKESDGAQPKVCFLSTSASDQCITRPNPPCDVHVLFTAAELRQFASEHTHIAQQMRLGCPSDQSVRV